METKFQIFLILLGVLAGTALVARRVDIAPAILLLLAGIGLAFVPGMPSVELPPELVLLVVLPPLIYSASVAMSWREFKFNLRPIILLSVGCVIFTAFAVAAATHYLIGLPWAVGFLLGAIVAPPDVVAPLAIARKLGMPRRVLVVLEGEGLANDATALILYRFAVVAISTGLFSLPKATGTFFAIVICEMLFGAAVGWLSLRMRHRARDTHGFHAPDHNAVRPIGEHPIGRIRNHLHRNARRNHRTERPKEFAHAIKARLFIHQCKGDATMAANALTEIALSFTANGDNARYVFGTTETTANPWYQFNQQRGDISFSSGTVATMMTDLNDPRLPILIDTSKIDALLYYGVTDAPVEFITYDELLFAAAEAVLRNGGSFGYASMLPDGVPERNPTVTVTRVLGRPDASKVREFADDIRDGKFLLPVSRQLPLRDASAAHVLVQRGGAGKIVLVCRDM